MHKKVLTEQALYYGDVAMPKDWDIDRDKLSSDILQSVIQNKNFPFSRTFDMLNTYMRDHIGLEYGFTLVNKETWGNIYKPSETTIPLLTRLSFMDLVLLINRELPFLTRWMK